MGGCRLLSDHSLRRADLVALRVRERSVEPTAELSCFIREFSMRFPASWFCGLLAAVRRRSWCLRRSEVTSDDDGEGCRCESQREGDRQGDIDCELEAGHGGDGPEAEGGGGLDGVGNEVTGRRRGAAPAGRGRTTDQGDACSEP